MKFVIVALTVVICVRAFLPASGSRITEAAEKETEADLPEITWEDYQSGREMEAVILHFSFRDGTIVDWETPYYPAVVEKTEYRDITGDGKEEALVFLYFANTATEYRLIHIFEIKNGIVRDISPETVLGELTGNVWDMRIVESYADRNPVFRMASFAKENGMAFPDETLLVVYGENGWQIFRQVSWEVRRAVWKIKDLALQFCKK
ncbi:MAG: hypothetical protein K2H40_15550 [Lachnospiraceae bacterium]|nr:hypothetical protein [Lachnospiraceae bacterium]